MAGKFPNVPTHLQAKMERCVVRIKGEGKSKEQAITICFNSIVKESSVAKKRSGKKKKTTRQAKKARQEKRRNTEALVEFKDEELEDTEPIEIIEDEPKDTYPDESTEEEKFHTMVEVVETGPTSFTELDAEEEARKQARKVRNVAFDTEMLVGNIIHSPMEPAEKEGALKNLASDFGTRLRSVMNKEVKELSLDEAEFVAFAKAIPEPGIIEKAKLVTAQTGNLKDEDFAVVEDKGRRYPIHNELHVRDSLMRASKAIKEGGKDAVIANQAVDNIMSAAKKMGMGMPSKEMGNGLLIQKDNNGDWRWIGWVSNNFKDREGDIITEKAHQEFVQHLDDNPGDAPRFWSWHTKETERKHRADWWDYRNGFLLMSGKLTEKEAQGLLRVAAKERLGMSHGFVALRDPQNPHLIKFYRSYEASDLPLVSASNAFTDVNALLKQEVNTMSKDKTEYLTEVLGEEQAARLIKDTEEAQKTLDESGVESKEIEEEKDGGSPEETPETKETPDLEVLVELISEKVAEKLDLDGLEKWVEVTTKQLESLPVIAKTVTEMQKDSDEKLADIIESPVSKKQHAWSARESESEDNIVKEDDELKEVTKETANWLSDLAGAAPLPKDATEVLSGGIHYDA